MPHKFEWIEMEITKNREEYGLMKTDLSKQKIEDKKSYHAARQEPETYHL